MPPLLEPAVPAAEEDDGGDGAQQKQQEEKGTLDAVGSQQDEESGGNHGAGRSGGGCRRGWRAAAQAPARGARWAAGTGERSSARHARRLRPRARPNGCALASAALREWARAAGSAGHDSADSDLARTWPRVVHPALPGRPRPHPCAAPGRSPAGDAADGEGQRRRQRGHPDSAHRPTATAGLCIPEAGSTWGGAGTRRPAGGGRGASRRGLSGWHHGRAAAARARGHGCYGSGGSRGLRPGLSAQRHPAGPPAGPHRPGGTGRAPLRSRTPGLPPLQPPVPRSLEARRQGAPRSHGETARRRLEPAGGAAPASHLPAPHPEAGASEDAAGWAIACGGVPARRSVSPGQGLSWESGSPGTGGPSRPSPLNWARSPAERSGLQTWTLSLSREGGTLHPLISMLTLKPCLL